MADYKWFARGNVKSEEFLGKSQGDEYRGRIWAK